MDNSPDWQKLHFTDSVVVDLHAHATLAATLFKRLISRHPVWRTQLGFYPLSIRTNFNLLQEGGVDVVCSVVYPPERQIMDDIALIRFFNLRIGRLKHLKYVLGWHPAWRKLLHGSYFEVANRGFDDLEREVEAYNEAIAKQQHDASSKKRTIQIVKNAAQLQEIIQRGQDAPIAFIHAVEGAHSLHGKTGADSEILENLERFHERGAAYITLAHFYPNKIVNPTFPYPDYVLERVPDSREKYVWRDLTLGLTKLGEKVVERMMNLGMMIDVSHCTPIARQQVYEIAGEREYSVAATHVGAYAIKPSAYNLEDWEIEWIARHKGVVGVILMNYWLMPNETKLGLDFVSRTIEHLISVGGAEVAALGTDFDGFTDPPDEVSNAAELPRLTQRLLAERSSESGGKYQPEAIRGFLGANALNMLLNGWR